MDVCGAIREHFWTSQWPKKALTILQLKDFHVYDFNMVDHTNTKSKQKKSPPAKKLFYNCMLKCSMDDQNFSPRQFLFCNGSYVLMSE